MNAAEQKLCADWQQIVFPEADARREVDAFAANFARAVIGAELADETGVGDYTGSGLVFKSQLMLCELVKDAAQNGRPLPAPVEPTGSLRRYAAQFGEGSAAKAVLEAAAGRVGWDCAEFDGFDVPAAEFEQACRFALVAVRAYVDAREAAALRRRSQLTNADRELRESRHAPCGLALYCCNRVKFCQALRLHRLSTEDGARIYELLAGIYRRIYRLGGMQQ